MIKISILYPNNNGARFDLRYYIDKHMPMSIELLGAHAGFRGVSVEHGLGGGIPGTEAAYVAMCHTTSSTRSKTSWLLSCPTQQCSRATCQTTQTSSRLFKSTKCSFPNSASN